MLSGRVTKGGKMTKNKLKREDAQGTPHIHTYLYSEGAAGSRR